MISGNDIQYWSETLRTWVNSTPFHPAVFMNITYQARYPWAEVQQHEEDVTYLYSRRDPSHSFSGHANTWIRHWIDSSLDAGTWDILGRVIRVEPAPTPQLLTVLDRTDWVRMGYRILDRGTL